MAEAINSAERSEAERQQCLHCGAKPALPRSGAARGVIAEFDSYGAKVCIVGEVTSSVTLRVPPSPQGEGFWREGAAAPLKGKALESGRMISAPTGDRCPEWVIVGQGLMIARCREYRAETGEWPGKELLERFSAEMGKRLDDFIRDPKGHPWKAMGLREFEREEGLGIRD